MPELAEVEYYRRRWDPGVGRPVLRVVLHPAVRDFRGTDAPQLARRLRGAVLCASQARGKQMLFSFSRGAASPNLWLGIHLGMTGRLRVEPAKKPILGTHDHLILIQADQLLVFSDPRQFGRVLFGDDDGAGEARNKIDDPGGPTERMPKWWRILPPSVLSRDFTVDEVCKFLRRHRRAPIKAVLLRQERFPGVGNWMADEILYRGRIHPGSPAGSLTSEEIRRLWRETRAVARIALRKIAPDWGDLPPEWLFHERWNDGGICPQTGVALVRETIGGRTTCWSPAWQGVAPKSSR